jgi:signal transduction histidine kinase
MTSHPPTLPTDQWRVLLVEDDEALRDSVSAVLTDAGYLLSTCDNGRDALAHLKANPADIVVLDLMMPIMNGWEFRTAQREDLAIADVPVVVISADRSAKASAVHADSYVRKPFRAGDLLHEIERVLLERSRQHQGTLSEEARRLTLLGQVAAGVGHDINNPLAFAMGNLEMIDETLSGFGDDVALLRGACRTADHASALGRIAQRLATTQDFLRDSRTGVDRVRLIVRNLQSLGQRGEDVRERLDLRAILDRSISAASTRIEYCSRLVRDYQEGAAVWGSERRLAHAFVNLLVNAAESMTPGQLDANTIRLTVRRVDNWCIAEIADNGSGMSVAVQRRIFEPFFTTKGREGGLGLGLAICRDIVEANGGTIDAESNGTTGSTFRVRLPALLKARPDAAPSPDVSKTSAPSTTKPLLRRPRLWVLDDEHLVAKTVGRILGEAYDVVMLDDPMTVLHRLELGETFDVLLCDLMMPHMTGMEVHERIAAIHPDLVPRVIFMTGGASTHEGREFAARRGIPLIDKPFDAIRVRAMLDAVTKKAF